VNDKYSYLIGVRKSKLPMPKQHLIKWAQQDITVLSTFGEWVIYIS
jgi:hypothetical protein